MRVKISRPVRPPCEPVTGVGTMTSKGYRPTNHAWIDDLAPRSMREVGGDGRPHRAGIDPRKISTTNLALAGHPARSATACMRAYLTWRDMPGGKAYTRDPAFAADMRKLRAEYKGLRMLRALCMGCSNNNEQEVKRCACIDCPLWVHRLGKNPHNKRSAEE